jgi:hypothetical protein
MHLQAAPLKPPFVMPQFDIVSSHAPSDLHSS